MTWLRSSFCSTDHATEQCVEVEWRWGRGEVAVRDSKHPNGSELVFTAAEWVTFLLAVKEGEFDVPS